MMSSFGKDQSENLPSVGYQSSEFLAPSARRHIPGFLLLQHKSLITRQQVRMLQIYLSKYQQLFTREGERSLLAKMRLTFSNGKMQTHGQTHAESPPFQLFSQMSFLNAPCPIAFLSHSQLNNSSAMNSDGKSCSLTPSYFL